MGYVKVDNRASGHGIREYDTVPCGHCQAVINKQQWRDDGGIYKCSGCKKPVCQHCCSKPTLDGSAGILCDPWQEKVERAIRNWGRVTEI